MTRQPQIQELCAQPAAVHRALTDSEEMPAVIDAGFTQLFRRLGDRGVEPSAPPFIRYLHTGDPLEIELGVPVAADEARLTGLETAVLPPGRTAELRHIGPYEELRAACEDLMRWLQRRDERACGPFWESYVTNPAAEPDPSRRVTEVCVPLRG